MKCVMLGDIHLGLYNDSPIWHDVTLNLFEEVLDNCERKNIDNIFILGDLFHNRKSTNTVTEKVALQIADLLSKKQTTMLVGNHDAYYKTSLIPNSLQKFKNYSNIKIIDKIETIDNIVLCPWDTIPKGFRGGYCFGHFELNGFYMNDGYKCHKGQDPQQLLLNEFDHIYSGHFHMPRSQGTITYIGAPFQHNFGDVGQSRGYYIFDDGELEFIKFTNAPEFVKIHINDKKQVFENEKIEGNIVKLVFQKDFGTVINERIIDGVMAMKPLKMNNDFSLIVENEDDVVNEEISIDMMEHNKIIENYISGFKLPENVNKTTLIKMMLKFKKELEE